MAGSEWATMDTVLPEADLHVRGTIPGPEGKLTFWMMQPRPKGMSLNEWDAITAERWNRAFARKETA